MTDNTTLHLEVTASGALISTGRTTPGNFRKHRGCLIVFRIVNIPDGTHPDKVRSLASQTVLSKAICRGGGSDAYFDAENYVYDYAELGVGRLAK